MKKLMFLTVLFAAFVFISCGNDVANTNGDNEVADEVTDDLSDEVLTESDETTDDDSDEVQVLKELNIEPDTNELEQVATDISLEVYSNGWGDLLDTLTMGTEGNIKLEVAEENPYEGDTPSYFIYETADGFFTNIAYAVFEDTIDVNLDPIMPDYLNGVIFMVQYYFGPSALSNSSVTVYTKDKSPVGYFTTENRGRFTINLPDGDYIFSFKDKDMDVSEYDVEVTVDSDYLELRVFAEAQMEKPNIYLYPETTVELDVSIDFPLGGFVTTSIPEYGSGWHVTVEPDGTIDGEYGHLFYESQNPDVFQYKNGWTVTNSALEKFFRENLVLYGFEGKEIEDFIEWWIPRLDGGCYDIYPQTASEIDLVAKLEISIIPDSLQRLSYAVRQTDSCFDHLSIPEIKPFERSGFSVLEWGVILK